MEKQQFSVVINAPKEKVWHTMLDLNTYKIWTAPFMPGSFYEGNWKQSSKMRFIVKDEKGKMSGMVSHIKENRPYEFISIEHKGIVEDGKEKEVPELAGSLENYTFKEIDGKTKVIVDLYGLGVIEEFEIDIWSKALQILKELAEK
jgi:hypothetical protein